MEIKDLTDQALLYELDREILKITQLKKQREGLDGQLSTENIRRHELEREIIRRFEGVINDKRLNK